MTSPAAVEDPINRRILAVSEDTLEGFQRDPLGLIAERSGVAANQVIERIRGMMRAGTIRRVRQTLISNRLAPGALVAWRVPGACLHDAFDYMFDQDPFSGHVVIRSTDEQTAGSDYRLWTTLKVPVGFSLSRHCAVLAERTGAEHFILLPARKLFALGVGHMRRRGLEPGSRTEEPARMLEADVVFLDEGEWRVLRALKREFAVDEIKSDLWAGRAAEAGLSRDEFCQVAERLCSRRVIGRFSTFLEHVKRLADGSTVTRYNALFHWAVPEGREVEAGLEVGRHHCMTHAYWREGGPAFNHVNIMGVAHGTEKQRVLDHKAAIDRHLVEAGICLNYTNVFWGGRSEIKPSEICPRAYRQWCERLGIDPDRQRDP